MANLPNNPFAELRHLETRVDGRLEMLGRAETNLRGLLDSLRDQVAAAIPVVEKLNALVPAARENVAQHATLGEVSAALAIGVDAARGDLEDQASKLRRLMADQLGEAVDVARAAMLTAEIRMPAEDELAGLVAAFRAEARGTLDAVRESLSDQLDLLPADVRLRVEPVLNEVDAARRQAEGAVRGAADGAQADMRRRADQLRQSIDDISVVLEERLTQRTAALHARAEAAMNALKPAMDERLTSLLAALESTLQARERELVGRIDAYPHRLDRQLADAENALMDRLARCEKHATDMTQYLENKLTARVDELIGRMRLKLHREIGDVAGTPTPEPRTILPTPTPGPIPPMVAALRPAPEPTPEPAAPSLHATIFVRDSRHPNFSQAA